MKFGSDTEHHQCQCGQGWVGNGVQVRHYTIPHFTTPYLTTPHYTTPPQCYDSSTGASSPELPAGSSSGDVSLTLAVTNQYYVYPHDSAQFPTVSFLQCSIEQLTYVQKSLA